LQICRSLSYTNFELDPKLWQSAAEYIHATNLSTEGWYGIRL